jgi:hypothetical protein
VTLRILALTDELSAVQAELALVKAERDALKQKLRGTCQVMLEKLGAIDIEVKDMIDGLNGARGDG